jgi:periplasmic protein TonB
MASMSGAAWSKMSPAPPSAPPPEGEHSRELFEGLVVSNPPVRRRGLWMPASIVGHLIGIAALILVPLIWMAPPPQTDYVRLLIYNPPPPPPPPLPKGSALLEKSQPKPVTPDPRPEKPDFTARIEKPEEIPLKPENRAPDTEQAGRPDGSDVGVPEGMEGGVEGGQVGGVPGGVLGGVVGGTGDGPVMDYDAPPRPIKMTKPEYPQDAFVKKIEGTVEVEFLIGIDGRVLSARVTKSVPMLDAEAIRTVRQWVFTPAMKGGRAVATIARAPVQFHIF